MSSTYSMSKGVSVHAELPISTNSVFLHPFLLPGIDFECVLRCCCGGISSTQHLCKRNSAYSLDPCRCHQKLSNLFSFLYVMGVGANIHLNVQRVLKMFLKKMWNGFDNNQLQ